ncbi:ABC transporter permease [Rhodococcus sp. BP-332]|uniref:ABC transporter permease n=1 Tax=Rhodococcus sp. BP-332 TaxID=2739447 RepID=UPI001C9AE4C5|nr:ABC transporter permease [Rhodococcus sp. BP-332]MBY6677899.1 ABC transporter permease [Rhodococcus sp. BP-332]
MSPTAGGLLRAEIRRVGSLRSWWALGLPPVLIGGFASAVYAAIASSDALTGVDDANRVAALIGLYVTVGVSVLFAAVFGAVHAATDLRHGAASTTFLAAPRRGQVVAARILVSAAVGAAYAVVSVLVSVASLALFGGNTVVDDGLVIAVCLLGIVVSALWCVLGCGLGLLTGSPAIAAIVVVAWLPIGELVVIAVLSGIGAEAVAALLLGATTVAIMAADKGTDGDMLLPFSAAVIGLLLWTIGIAGAGWLRTTRRDVT